MKNRRRAEPAFLLSDGMSGRRFIFFLFLLHFPRFLPSNKVKGGNKRWDSLRYQVKIRLKEWISRYSDDVLRTCFVLLSDQSLAEDAMQDTFTKAWKSMSQFEGREDASPKTWLMRIAVNTCKDYRRTQWLRHRSQTSPIDELPEAVLPTTNVSRELFLTVMGLPDKYKQVVLLYHYQNMTMEEVADALRVSRPAVSGRLKKAYELLRAELEGGAEHELG